MCRRGRKLGNQRIAIGPGQVLVELRHERIGAAVPKHLGLRDVGHRVEVEPVRRRAVCLVPRLDAALPAPLGPLRKHVFHDDVRKRFPHIAANAGHAVGVPLPGQRRNLVLDPVAAPRGEGRGQVGRPVRAEVLERVVIHRPGSRDAGCVKRRREPLEIGPHRYRRERIDHRTLSAGCGPLDHRAGELVADQAHHPTLARRLPVERAVAAKPARDLFPLAVGPLGDNRLHRDALRVDVGRQLAVGRRREALHDQFPPTQFGRDIRPAETPAGAGGHVDADPHPLSFLDGERQHLEPAWAEVVDVAALGTLRAVDRNDVNPAQPPGAVPLKLLRQVLLIHRASEPPVVGPRAAPIDCVRPVERPRRHWQSEKQHQRPCQRNEASHVRFPYLHYLFLHR